MSTADLPTLNACLNAATTALLLAGYVFIRRDQRNRHRACMLSALGMSALFFTSYIIYHAQVGSVPFRGHGPVRVLYFVILISHVLLAVAIVPLAAMTATRALTGRFARHRAIARWTLPLWLYVSVTGVIVYLMLYRMSWP